MTSEPSLEFRSVSKDFPASAAVRHALRNVSFAVRSGTSVAVVGRSGSGKSTLLHLAAGIETPSSGQVLIDGVDIASLNETERARLRRDRVGLVFQFFYLLPHLTVAQNVALPELIAGSKKSEYGNRVEHLLDRVGLGDRADDPSGKLSGGEMQRVAICRSLIRSPSLILADEPTGNLDADNAETVMTLLLDLSKESGVTLLFVTHDQELVPLADRSFTLHDGELE